MGRVRPRRALATAVGALVLAQSALVGCTGDDPPDEPLPRAAAPPPEVVRDGAYDWQRVPLGAGGFVTGLVTAGTGDDAELYARTDVGGAYRWEPDRQEWVQLLLADALADGDLAPGDYTVASIAVAPGDPDTVVVAVGNDYEPGPDEEPPRTGRVLRSDDGGRTWTGSEQRWWVAGNQFFRTGSERLAIDPRDPDVVWFGTQREGLWRSEDGGATWAEVASDDVPSGVAGEVERTEVGPYLVTYLPETDADPATVVVGVAGEGLFTSSDDGATWTRRLALEAGEIPSSPTPQGDDLLFSVTTLDRPDGRIVRLSDGGSTVTDLVPPIGATTWNLAVDPHDPDLVIASTEGVSDGRLWSSTDAGATWRAHGIEVDARRIPWLAATDVEDYMAIGRYLFDPVRPGRVWLAEGLGVWRTDDLGAEDTVTWSQVGRGIEELVVSGITAPAGSDPIATVADRQGFRIESFDHYPSAPLVDDGFASGTGLDVSAGHPDRVAWVGAQSNIDPSQATPRGAVSDDGGATWEEMGGMVPAMFGGEVAVSATDPDAMVWLPTHIGHPYQFQQDPLGLYASADGGRSWEHVRPTGDVDSFHRFFWWFTRRALAADRVDGSFYLMSDEEHLYRSTDGGRTWTEAEHAPPCTEPVQCHVVGQVQAVPGQAGHLWASTGQAGLHRTDDAGATAWAPVPGIVEARAFAFGAPVGDHDEPAVYVHGRGEGEPEGALGIWRSVDGGATWTLLSRHPFGLAADIVSLGADPDVPGRVFVGFSGSGLVVGDEPSG